LCAIWSICMSILTPDIIRLFAQEWNSFSGSEEV
jgi:hypothetical protein